MKTLTVKLSDDLDQKLTALATQQGESKSTMVRTAIERILESSDQISPASCLHLARDLAGCVEGVRDLSHNKKHFEDYGR
jgi:predicted transcriptional regulator